VINQRHLRLSALCALLSAGCAPVEWVPEPPPPSYEELDQICGLEEAGPGYGLTEYGELDVSEDCAAVIGELLGVDWWSFNEDEPHEIDDPDLAVESVIGAALLLLSPQGFPIDAIDQPDAPPDLVGFLDRLAETHELDPGEDAGRLWYRLIARTIREVVYAPDTPLLG
jgi:hypothetical protein